LTCGVAELARQAHRARQVGRAEEQRIDAVDGGDGFQLRPPPAVSSCTITEIGGWHS
jgi:hypothetical protein